MEKLTLETKAGRFSWSLDSVNTAGYRLAELPSPSADAELARAQGAVSTFSHLAISCQKKIMPGLSCIMSRVQK